jgi:SAM-dependent methyltransferase
LIELERAPELWRCEACASAFTQFPVPEPDARRLYAEGVGDRWSSPRPFEDTRAREVVHALEALFARGSRVLDIGCNTGELLDFAKRRGCVTAGVELSAAGRAACEAHGHEIFEELSACTGSYDVLTALDLVEHLYDVPGFLRRCHGLLADGGALVVVTGDPGWDEATREGPRWWYVQPPEHVVFPSRRFWEGAPGFRLERAEHSTADVSREPSLARRALSAARSLRRGAGWRHLVAVLRKEAPR